MNGNRETNQAAFRRVQEEFRGRFPQGHFVAFDGGQFVAEGASFDELTENLAAMNKDRSDVFVVQVGVEYPEEVCILL